MNSPQQNTVKCGGIKTLTSLPHIYAIVLMGLFTFIFLSIEYMFVNGLSLLVSEQKATLSQNYVLGVSTAGFLLYPLLKHFLSRRLQNILMILAALLSVFLQYSLHAVSHLNIYFTQELFFLYFLVLLEVMYTMYLHV